MILAVDPGKTTGWATYSERAGVHFGQIESRQWFYKWFDDEVRIDAVVSEKYTITDATGKMSKQYDALYINGYLEGECHLGGIPFTLQTPSEAKGFLPDGALKALGWWRTGLPHGMDAARHLGLYLVNSKHKAAEGIMEVLLDA